jgi:hypothetical protein
MPNMQQILKTLIAHDYSMKIKNIVFSLLIFYMVS